MRIWKRLLGLALCLCAAVCVMSVSASAAEHNDHPVCGETHTDIGDHTGPCNAVEWIKVTQEDVTDSNGLTLKTGKSYYLGEDIKVKWDITIKGTVNLCLNGHSITKTSESSTFEGVITVTAGSSFTLCDCNGSGAGNGKLTHADNVTGRGVLVGSSSSSHRTTFFLMYGGTISGNHINGQDGAGVLVHSASFKMYGGTISENRVEGRTNYGGGGVAAHTSGKFIMYGGEISGNTSDVGGGGVAVVGASFEMHGGTISGNTATDSGGGVDLWNDSFRLSGGTISGNTAKDGGGVYFSANSNNILTISDTVKIEDNTAANGGGVYINSYNLTVTGGSISGNTATNSGGGVYFAGSSFNVSGDVNITGNVVDSSPNNVYLPDGKIITVGGALTGSDKIGVTTENTPNDSNYVRIALGNKDYTDPEKFRYENNDTIAVSAVVSGSTATLVACQHNWTGEWTTDDTQHWKECSICKGKNDVSGHNYDEMFVADGYKKSDANCKSPAVYYKSCVCGAKGTDTFTSDETNPDNHAGTLSGWQWNEDKHWKEYSCCHAEAEKGEHAWDEGEVTEAATCTAAGEKTYTCSVCNRTKKETLAALKHNYGEPTYAWNGTNCTAERVCSRDGSHKETETVKAVVTVTQDRSCTQDELSTYTATFTNTAFAPQTKTNVKTADNLGHKWKTNEWSHDATHHWNECQNENCPVTDNSQKNDYKEHNGGTATCQAKAVCAICGTAYGETDASNHTGTETWVTTATTHEKKWSCCGAVTVASAEHNWNTPTIAPATCTAAGNKHYTCTECGATKDEIIPASGHDWAADLTEDTPATCEHTGSKSKHCSRCAEITDVTEIPALGHDFKNGKWQSDADHHWKKCSRCDATDEASKVPHNWGAGEVTTAATCTEPGNMRYTCETCSAEKDETISAAGHDYSVPLGNAATATCETDGKETDMKCSRCDAVETGKTLPALGHDPVHHDAKAASCTGIGWNAYDTCSRCDYTTYKEIAALGHDFVNGSYQHDTDHHWKKCSRCDAEDAKAAHNFSQNGRTYTCTDCGYSYTVSSGGGSSTITVPVTGSRDTVKISASVSGGTAEVKEIRQDELDKIGTDSDVVIDLAGLGKSVTGAALSVGTVERISGSQADGALIKLPHAQIRLDRQTLAALAQQASGSKVQLVVETNTKAKSTMTAAQKQALDGMKNAAAIEAYFVSNGQRIYDFNGGQVELTIPYQAGGAIRGWYLKEDGTREQVSAVYDKENARLTLRHFSHYVIEELEAGMAYAACPRDSSCPIAPYTDAAPTAWYHDGVHYCIDNGLMQGVSSTQFLPDGSTTRAQLVTILWRLEGAPAARGDETFLDAADGAWYTAAVRWAAGEGIVRGYGDGRFGPDDAVTREQMVAILYRFAQYKGADVSVGGDTNILSFSDAAAVSEYAVPAMQWACGSGLVAGVAQEGGLALVPKGTTTRAQAATLMMRFQSIFVKNT